MPDQTTRRTFLKSTALAAAGSALASPAGRALADQPEGRGGPIVVSSANGLNATDRAVQLLRRGTDPVDAVVAGVNLVENDPNDLTVGYGGLPNDRGVVQLDASVMHGPSCGAGAVAAIENIKNPSSVALLVMRRTDHCLIVGQGAKEFALAHGFKEENLLTDEARRIWLRWKENLSDKDDWIAPPDDRQGAAVRDYLRTYGTINCLALDGHGDLAGVTTTSGLAFKIPGRVGDSPIIGAGLYVDNEVGAAGSTGRGEAVIKTCGAFAIVEQMRNGATPQEACLTILRRIVKQTRERRLLTADGKPNFDVKFYAVRKDGLFGGAAIGSGGQMAVNDGKSNRLVEMAYLYERPNGKS